MLLLLDQVQREDVSESQEDSAWVKGAWTAAESLCSCWLKGTSGSIYIKRLLLQTSLESTALHTQTFFLGPFSLKKIKVHQSVCTYVGVHWKYRKGAPICMKAEQPFNNNFIAHACMYFLHVCFMFPCGWNACRKRKQQDKGEWGF